MYFHPPTLDPGWLATLVGLATLLLLLVQPLLVRSLTRRPGRPGRVSPLTRRRRLGALLSLTEVLAAAAFVAAADVVTSADLGLIVPRLQGHEPEAPSPLAGDLVSWVGTVVVLVAAAAFVAALVVQRRHDGAGGSGPASGPEDPVNWGDAEWRWALGHVTLGGLATTVVLFVVVYPLVTVFAGPLAAVAAVALLLGGQQWGNGYQQTLVLTAYGALMALCHAFLSAGSLFVPVVFWCALAYAYGRSLRQQRLQISQAAPMEVTMLDADGNPVRRPGS
ncbi:hypothetical protein ACF07Q_04770 [Nocardiopsis dassonvillei]|uniref:hypothetical protein n=1 Tax=Nocardiopsis dassonvillei TaxID=2014 RepID=UPI0036FB6102